MYVPAVEAAVREGLKQQPWGLLTAQVVLGNDAFVKQLQEQVHGNIQEQGNLRHWIQRPDMVQVIKAVETVWGESCENFLDRHGDWGRDLVLYLASENCGLSLRELGREVGGMRYKAVCEAIRRFKKRMQTNPSVAELVDRTTKLLKPNTRL